MSEAPAEPVVVAPPVPAEPVVPPVTQSPTADEAAAQADTDEWNNAEKELFPGLKSTQEKEGKKDESAKPGKIAETTETTTQTTIDPNETPEQKTAREAQEAADAEQAAGEDEPPDTTARDSRVAARETAAQLETLKIDVRKQMFESLPQVLQDADGDPINSVADVVKLINPQTGEPFTVEEAGAWFISAQQQFNQKMANTDKEIDRIAETNLDLKDQADAITYKYGAILKEKPELRDRIWAEYEKTLEKDPESNIVIKMPVSLERFYEAILEPYAELGETLETQQTAQQLKEAEDAKVAAEAQKQKNRTDRSDIYGGGNTDLTDPEDKEWADAATAVFGPKVNKK